MKTNRFSRAAGGIIAALCMFLASGLASAQVLPVTVNVTGNTAVARILSPLGAVLGDVTLTFDDASGLSAASLGIRAELVNPNDIALLSRLPDANLVRVPTSLPLLVTIEPPVNGGLTFRRTGRYQLHTHALVYSAGSNLRVLKAQLGAKFRDTTEEIASGSVRANSRYGGFSQFLVAVDLRPTGAVTDEKIAFLRGRIAMLPKREQPELTRLLDMAEDSISKGAYSSAISAIDSFTARVADRAGRWIPDEWRATRNVENHAGELLAGAATLKFSVNYLRDYGQ